MLVTLAMALYFPCLFGYITIGLARPIRTHIFQSERLLVKPKRLCTDLCMEPVGVWNRLKSHIFSSSISHTHYFIWLLTSRPTWLKEDHGPLSWTHQIDGLVQERCNFIANALELHLSCNNPSKYEWWLALLWHHKQMSWCHQDICLWRHNSTSNH